MVTVVLEKGDGFFWCQLRGHRSVAKAGLIRNKDFYLQIFVRHSKSLKKKQKAKAECDVTC